MEIIPVIPRGYCKGVTHAIALAKKTAKENPGVPITMLGMIVHNRFVVEALKLDNIQCVEAKGKTRLELLEQIKEGIVIFTAHGVSEEVFLQAKRQGLRCVDASCSDVIATQQLVKAKLSQGYEVFYIGKQQHPEAEAVLSISSHVHPIYDIACIDCLEPTSENIVITNQTTMSILEIEELIQRLKLKFPQAEVEQEICNATRIRQQAIQQLKQIDLLIVVGDPQSNNSNKLKDIAIESGIPHVLLIESIHQLVLSEIEHYQRIAITSGASTPTYLTQQVIVFLQDYATGKNPTYPSINLTQLL